MIKYTKDHPNAGYRKAAEHFGVGRTQAQKILKERDAILAQHEQSRYSAKQKRVRTATFTDVNKALWDWYTICRESNIPVSGAMLQQEALIIADRLGVSDFTASNGWLQCFKQNYNLQRMATAGEDGDVSSETLESWNEREREITRGWKPDDV